MNSLLETISYIYSAFLRVIAKVWMSNFLQTKSSWSNSKYFLLTKSFLISITSSTVAKYNKISKRLYFSKFSVLKSNEGNYSNIPIDFSLMAYFKTFSEANKWLIITNNSFLKVLSSDLYP